MLSNNNLKQKSLQQHSRLLLPPSGQFPILLCTFFTTNRCCISAVCLYSKSLPNVAPFKYRPTKSTAMTNMASTFQDDLLRQDKRRAARSSVPRGGVCALQRRQPQTAQKKAHLMDCDSLLCPRISSCRENRLQKSELCICAPDRTSLIVGQRNVTLGKFTSG